MKPDVGLFAHYPETGFEETTGDALEWDLSAVQRRMQIAGDVHRVTADKVTLIVLISRRRQPV